MKALIPEIKISLDTKKDTRNGASEPAQKCTVILAAVVDAQR